jgi:16S rRNA (cytosine967-C5)-methyltransferase
VVYATCSLEAEENEEVVAAVLKGRFDVRIVSLSERIAAMHAAGLVTDEGARRLRGCMTPEGYLRLLPGVLHTDGFFVALVEKLPEKLAAHLRSQAESREVAAEQDA